MICYLDFWWKCLVLNMGIISAFVVRDNYLWRNQVVNSIWQNIQIINWFEFWMIQTEKHVDRLINDASSKRKKQDVYPPARNKNHRKKFFDRQIFNLRLSCSLQHIILETRFECEKLGFRHLYRENGTDSKHVHFASNNYHNIKSVKYRHWLQSGWQLTRNNIKAEHESNALWKTSLTINFHSE